jgi:hypothetical protein
LGGRENGMEAGLSLVDIATGEARREGGSPARDWSGRERVCACTKTVVRGYAEMRRRDGPEAGLGSPSVEDLLLSSLLERL